MQRALDLRDDLPTGRRRAETPRRGGYVPTVVGATGTVSGIVILASIAPGWNWLGALGAGLGTALILLGVTDILNQGDNGTRRVARLFRVVRLAGSFLTITLVVLDLVLALAAVALLAVAVFQGQWSQTVESLLAGAALVAALALGLALMVRVAELPVVPLARISWWRELGNLQQITHMAIAMTGVGTAVAFGLRDAGGAAIATVGLATVLLGWARTDRTATENEGCAGGGGGGRPGLGGVAARWRRVSPAQARDSVASPCRPTPHEWTCEDRLPRSKKPRRKSA